MIIDEKKINQLKELESQGSIILVSNHISYIDYLILTYVFYAYQLKCSFVHAGNVLTNITIISKILLAGGCFFTETKKNSLHRCIVLLFKENCNIGF